MSYSYLALGDSYTIGEQVPLAESFPYQLVQLLRKSANAMRSLQPNFAAPEIIAKTGWTTDELSMAIENTELQVQYGFVSLLIGVNNQYRGRSVSEFKIEFDHLLQRAIQFAGSKAGNVFVLSIPDWGVTPFAAGKDTAKIAAEIDAFNQVCNKSAEKFGARYIDITSSQRKDNNEPGYLAADQLHPSGKEYAKWAAAMQDVFRNKIRG